MIYPPPHQVLKFATAKCIYEMIDDDSDSVVVEWQVFDDQPGRYDRLRYELTLRFPGGYPSTAKTYSLLTLGAQSPDHKNIITAVEAKTFQGDARAVMFRLRDSAGDTVDTTLDLTNAAQQAAGGLEIPRSGATGTTVDEQGVWFLSFPRDVYMCRLSFAMVDGPVYGRRVGLTPWVGGTYSDGHDTVPPNNPPD